jgi:hypothetical protein
MKKLRFVVSLISDDNDYRGQLRSGGQRIAFAVRADDHEVGQIQTTPLESS